MSQIQMLKMAVTLYPRRDYLDVTAVRHARRKWLQSVAMLRGRAESAWILDQKVARLT